MAQHYLFNSKIKDYLDNDLKYYIRKLEKLEDSSAMVEVGHIVANAIDPYVPYETGKLADYRVTSKGNILYDTKYAQAQYYGPDEGWVRTRNPHHRATSMWDIVAVNDPDVIDQINREFYDLLVRSEK